MLSINGVRGPAFTGMPPIIGPGGGAGEVATAACRTGLPLNLLGSETTGAATGTATTCLAADRLRTFARSSAFSFSILSSRAITSSSVADRAAPPNEIRQRAAQAVPERSLFLMTYPQVRSPIQLPSEGSVGYARYQLEGLEHVVNEILVSCHKKGTVILLQCSNLSQCCATLTHLRVARIDLDELSWP